MKLSEILKNKDESITNICDWLRVKFPVHERRNPSSPMYHTSALTYAEITHEYMQTVDNSLLSEINELREQNSDMVDKIRTMNYILKRWQNGDNKPDYLNDLIAEATDFLTANS